ncbi:hypothetical protein [Streptacidiphilus albus]|uniref:hypothetical protein n=1 Tax=Streptacidiphilus albus TaxID=105425 RepID=UPI00054B0385|nr:hypothetical protein [Streptacidiphilus albus]
MTHRHDVQRDIITRTLEELIPRSVPARLTVKVTETFDAPGGHPRQNTWEGSVHGLAERIATALYGRRPETGSPLEQAEAAKQNRDLAGELGALMGGAAALQQQPWYPARPGDVVHIAYEAVHDLPGSGSTYLVQQNPDEPAFLALVAVAVSDTDGGVWATDGDPDPLFEMWMEAGGHRITVVRDGLTVHNGPASRGR